MKVLRSLVSIFLFAILFLCCSYSNSQAWKLVFIEESGLEIYLDIDNVVQLSDNVVRVWEKTSTRKSSDKPILYLIDVDCNFRVFRTLRTISGDEDLSQNTPDSIKWQPLEIIGNADSRERLYQMLCGNPQQK